MKHHLALGGKWLAGAGGLTALGYLVATEAAPGRHPVWPYWLFGALLIIGLALYFTCQDREAHQTTQGDVMRPAGLTDSESQQAGDTESQDTATTQQDSAPVIKASEDQVWSAWNEQYYDEHETPEEPQCAPGDPLTDRWRHTADGFKASPLMNITSYAMPGFMGSPDEVPFIRIGVCVASEPVESESVDSSQIRIALSNFLGRGPVAGLIQTMTYIEDSSSWIPQAGRGPLRIDAILRTQGTAVASAMLHLPFKDLRSAGRAEGMACLWLQIVPRDADGGTAAPVGLADWHRRLVLALSIADAFVDLLCCDLALSASGQPSARVGILLQSQKPALADLVDAENLPTLQGASPSNQFLGYAIADLAGKPNNGAARDFLRQLCDYDLQVDVSGQFLQAIGPA